VNLKVYTASWFRGQKVYLLNKISMGRDAFYLCRDISPGYDYSFLSSLGLDKENVFFLFL